MSTKRFSIEAVFKVHDQMSRAIGKIAGRAERFTRSFRRGLRAVDRRIGKVTARLGRMFTGAMGFLGRGLTVGAAAATAALAATAVAMNRVASGADDLGKLTERIEFPIEEFQTWRFAAQQSGVSNDAFASSMDRFVKRIGEAKAGTGTLYGILKRGQPTLLRQLQATSDSAEALDLYRRALSKVEDPTKRAALTAAAFGRAGLQMSTLLTASEESIRALRLEAEQNGIVTRAQARAAAQYNDALASLKGAVGGLLQSALLPMMPAITRVMRRTRDWVAANREVISERLTSFLRDTGTRILRVARSIGTWVAVNEDLIRSELTGFLDDARSAVTKLRDNLPEIVKWLKRIGTAAAAVLAIETASRVAQAALVGLKGILWLTRKAKLAYAWATGVAAAAEWGFASAAGASTRALGPLKGAATAVGGRFAALRGALAAPALGGGIKGLTLLLGKGGLLTAAAGVGFAIGSWLDHKFKISEMVSGWMADFDGLNSVVEKTGQFLGIAALEDIGRGLRQRNQDLQEIGRSTERGTGGAVRKLAAKMETRLPAPDGGLARTTDSAEAGQLPQVVNPQMAAARETARETAREVQRLVTESSDTTTTREEVEVTIRNESGQRIDVGRKRPGRSTRLRLDPSGAF